MVTRERTVFSQEVDQRCLNLGWLRGLLVFEMSLQLLCVLWNEKTSG